MKVGDLVIRKLSRIDQATPLLRQNAKEMNEELGIGLILSKQMAGSNPIHPCVTVYYSKTGQVYDIAESLVEILSESQR